MESIIYLAKLIGLCIVLVVVMETTTKVYRKVVPPPQPELKIIVEHHVSADGINGKIDITTDVLAVAIAIEDGTKTALTE